MAAPIKTSSNNTSNNSSNDSGAAQAATQSLVINRVAIRPDNPFLPTVSSQSSLRQAESVAQAPGAQAGAPVLGQPTGWQVRTESQANRAQGSPDKPAHARLKRLHSSPPRVEFARQWCPGKLPDSAPSNSSNSSLREPGSPYKSPDRKSPVPRPASTAAEITVRTAVQTAAQANTFWQFWPGAAGKRMQTEGIQIPVHDMVLEFRLRLREQMAAVKPGFTTTESDNSDANQLGEKFLMPLACNGPLDQGEVYGRLALAIHHLTADEIKLLPELITLMQGRPAAAVKVFGLVGRLLGQEMLADAERGAEVKKIGKEIKSLIADLWPHRFQLPKLKRTRKLHRSLGHAGRATEPTSAQSSSANLRFNRPGSGKRSNRLEKDD